MSSYFVLSFVSTVNIQDIVTLSVYDLDSFYLVCSSCGLNVTVHIHLLLGHQPTIINKPLRAFHISLFHHLSILIVFEGNSGRESNPPFQPTTRLSSKTVSGDRPSTAAVIKPSALSLFLLRKVNSV